MSSVTTDNIYTAPFFVDVTGIQIISVNHGLAGIPDITNCSLSIAMNSAVYDWGYDHLAMAVWTSVGSSVSTKLYARINISRASATSASTANLIFRLGVVSLAVIETTIVEIDRAVEVDTAQEITVA